MACLQNNALDIFSIILPLPVIGYWTLLNLNVDMSHNFLPNLHFSWYCSGALTVANLRRLNFNFTSQCKTKVKNNITVHVRPMLWTTRQSLPALFGCQYNTMRLDSAKIQISACSFRWNFAKVIYTRHFCLFSRLQRTVLVFRSRVIHYV